MGMGKRLRIQQVDQRLAAIAASARRNRRQRYSNLFDEIDADLLFAAWQRIRKTAAPGVDGVTPRTFERALETNLLRVLAELRRETWHPSPLRRAFIPKGNGDRRELGIPTIEDRLVQQALLLLLQPIYEQDFTNTSFGYRPGRNLHQALFTLKRHLTAHSGAFILDADIEAFFDQVSHEALRSALDRRVIDPSIRRLIDAFIEAGVLDSFHSRASIHLPDNDGSGVLQTRYDRNQGSMLQVRVRGHGHFSGGHRSNFFAAREGAGRWAPIPCPRVTDSPPRNDIGIPQGSTLSPLLANILLHDVLDVWFLRDQRPRLHGRALLVRYADDFVMAFANSVDAEETYRAVRQQLVRHGLRIHREKTTTVRFFHPEDPRNTGTQNGIVYFDFLGFRHTLHRAKRSGRITIHQQTSEPRIHRALGDFITWWRRSRLPVRIRERRLAARLGAYFTHHSLPGNSGAMWRFRSRLTRLIVGNCHVSEHNRRWHWKRLQRILPTPSFNLDRWRKRSQPIEADRSRTKREPERPHRDNTH